MNYETVLKAVSEEARDFGSILTLANITPQTSFVNDLGCDSLDMIEIVMGVEEELGLKLPTEVDEAFATAATIEDAVQVILRHIADTKPESTEAAL